MATLEAREFNRKLPARDWIVPAWPKQYGGLGASIYEQMVFNEEFGYCGGPDNRTRGFGVGMVGPMLIVHGTEEQRRGPGRGPLSDAVQGERACEW